MQNYMDLRQFLDISSKEEKESFFKESSDPLLTALAISIESGEFAPFQETVLENLDNYIPFFQKYYHQDIHKALIFPNLNLAKLFIKSGESKELILSMLLPLKLSGSELLILVSELANVSSLDLTYSVKDNNYSLDSSILPYAYLIPMLAIKHDDEFDLMCSVFDSIPMEVISQGTHILAVVKNNARNEVVNQRESILSQIKMIVTRAVNSPMTKYAGVALALGLVMMGSAEASSTDAVHTMESLNSALSNMAGNHPVGCEFGVDFLGFIKNDNGAITGAQYEVKMGDWQISQTFEKIGNVKSTLSQSVSKLKQLKGCGMSKSDALEMVEKIHAKVMAKWVAR